MAICNCIVLSGSFNSASLAESSIQSLYKTVIGTDIKKQNNTLYLEELISALYRTVAYTQNFIIIY